MRFLLDDFHILEDMDSGHFIRVKVTVD